MVLIRPSNALRTQAHQFARPTIFLFIVAGHDFYMNFGGQICCGYSSCFIVYDSLLAIQNGQEIMKPFRRLLNYVGGKVVSCTIRCFRILTKNLKMLGSADTNNLMQLFLQYN